MEQNSPVRIRNTTNKLLGQYKKEYKLKNRSDAIETAIQDSRTLKDLLESLATSSNSETEST